MRLMSSNTYHIFLIASRKIWHALFTAILFTSFSYSCLAQTQDGGIAGFVIDQQTREPLIGANVFIKDLRTGAATNKWGYFSIPNLSSGNYELQTSYIGYAGWSREIAVADGDFSKVSIELIPEAILVDKIEVTAESYQEEERNISTISMPVARLKSMPAIGESDLLRSLQLLPGVQSANELSTGLYIRGGSPDQNLILLDGITIYNPSHFFGFFSTFNTDAIKDVKLMKGGYPAEYGGRLSAVLDVTNKDGNRERTSTSGAVSLISSKFLLEGPLKKGSYMISGRRTYFDLIIPLSGVDDIPDYYFYDLNAKINIDHSDKDKFIISSYLGNDILDFSQNENGIATNQINIGWGNRVIAGQWMHLFNPKLYSNVLVALSDFDATIEADASGFPIEFTNRIKDASLKADLEWFGATRHILKFGIWLTKYEFSNSIKIGENTGFNNRIVNKPYYGAVYLQDEWEPNPLWRITSGLRMNYFSSGDRFHVEPRIQINRKIAENFGLTAAFGNYTQYTTVVVNDIASFADLWYPVDETIDALSSQQYILGMDYYIKKGYSLNLELYIKPLQNIVEFKPRQDTDRNRLDDIFYIGTGTAKGIEVLVQKRRGKLTGWLGYTWSKTDRKFDQLNNGETFPAKWDFTHDITFNTNYKFHRKWNLSSTFVYRSGQTYTVPTGQYRLGPPLFPIDYIRAGRKNSARLEPYHRLDISLSYLWKGFGGNWKLGLNIYNIYNHRNVWFRNYEFNDLGKAPKIEDIRLLPILPTLELSFKF